MPPCAVKLRRTRIASPREVDVAPSQPQQLAEPQPGERRGQERDAVLARRPRRAPVPTPPPGENASTSVEIRTRGALHADHRIVAAVPTRASRGGRSRAARRGTSGVVRFEHVSVVFHALQIHASSRPRSACARLPAHDQVCRAAVAVHRRRLAVTFVLGPPQPLRCGVGHRRARAHHARQLAAPREHQDVVVARPGRCASSNSPPPGRPRPVHAGPIRLLHLPPIGQPVLRIPLRPALARDPKHVSANHAAQ